MTRYEKIKSALDEMSTAELVNVHNAYCNAANRIDDYIYNMDEFDEIMDGQTPWEIARCAFYGNFRPAYDYFWFNGYGNLESSDFEPDIIYVPNIARFVDETENTLDNDTLCDIIAEDDDAARA